MTQIKPQNGKEPEFNSHFKNYHGLSKTSSAVSLVCYDRIQLFIFKVKSSSLGQWKWLFRNHEDSVKVSFPKEVDLA